jgi:hypothetical protein
MHGTNLTELLAHAVGYGPMPANTIGDVGLLTQALHLADASSGHTQQAELIRAQLLILGSNPPPATPREESVGAPSGYLCSGVPSVGGSTGVPSGIEVQEEIGEVDRDAGFVV